MVKRGRQDKTSIFGNDSESYISQLWWMMQNPNGCRRPDLVSINGRYDPRLSLEVKSGVNGKVSLVAYQLHYGITSERDYKELFGVDFKPIDSENRSSLLVPTRKTVFPKGNVSYYYNIISRSDEISSHAVGKPYAAISLDWQDQHVIPHEMAFHMFCIARYIRAKKNLVKEQKNGNILGIRDETLDNIVRDLHEKMRADIDQQSSHYRTSKQTQDWQNVYARDAKSVFFDDPNIASKEGQERIALLTQQYPEIMGLKRVTIPAPKGTFIYVLCDPSDYDLFNQQVRKTVESRINVIEKVWDERRDARSLLRKIRPLKGTQEFLRTNEESWGEDQDDIVYTTRSLKPRETRLLERLNRWVGKEGDFVEPYQDRKKSDVNWHANGPVASGNDDPLYDPEFESPKKSKISLKNAEQKISV